MVVRSTTTGTTLTASTPTSKLTHLTQPEPRLDLGGHAPLCDPLLYGSRRTSEGRLSSRIPIKDEWRSSASAIHSTNPITTRTTGLTQRKVLISSAVMPSPQCLLPVLFGRSTNRHRAI